MWSSCAKKERVTVQQKTRCRRCPGLYSWVVKQIHASISGLAPSRNRACSTLKQVIDDEAASNSNSATFSLQSRRLPRSHKL